MSLLESHLFFVSQDQAFDRAHRFGQTRDVNIFKLKIDGTVEDRILLVSQWGHSNGSKNQRASIAARKEASACCSCA